MTGLLVVRRPDTGETFLHVAADGAVIAFSGHVDLGTGIRTALAQIVAEDLDVALARVELVLGDTDRAPNQGPTIASETIQVAAIPLRCAAAQARLHLVALAAERLGVPAADLLVDDGIVHAGPGSNLSVSYGALIGDARLVLDLDPATPVKPVAAYRVVGQAAARVDIPAKATGQLVYVHDMRVPGMLHGRVVRPPYVGLDHGPFVGTSLLDVERESVAYIPGIVAIVVIADFIGIVAEREEHAEQAAGALRAHWRPTPSLPDLGDLPTALRANPATPRILQQRGDVDAALAEAATPMPRTYLWPYQMHASIGPSCALADWREDGLTIWAGTQNPHMLRADLAPLLGLTPERISIIRMEAAGCYGRNCADDVAADAALLSRAVGRPVRVQLTRAQEHGWEPKGAAQLMEVRGGLTAEGLPAGYDFSTRYPSNNAPLLAALLTGAIPPVPAVSDMGDRTAIPPYDYPHTRIVVHDMAPIVRASWLRGVSALPNSFAHESYIDELAEAAGADPVEYRLGLLRDPRAIALIRATAERAGWTPRPRPAREGEGDIRRGRGFAYAVYVHGRFPGTAAAWSAWVADVAVNIATGEVAVTRVVVGQDSGLMINPDGVRHQIEGNVIQSVSRTLKEAVTFSTSAVTSLEWGGYPILAFPEVPEIDVLMLPRPDQPPLGVGESASVPSAAAIANAVFDATGVRFRELPLTPERVLAGLRPAGLHPAAPRRRRRWLGAVAAVLGAAAAAWPGQGALAPIAPPDPGLYAPATIAHGRVLAALGGCAHCHTAEGGAAYAGGRPIATPFGTVVASNITPDAASGIGAWSYPAFARAMRQGLHRDGTHLYPAFPYPSYARASEADLQALYAYLTAQPAVANPVARSHLPLPFARPLLAAWNALFLREGAWQPVPGRSPEWNRGAYLVEGLGHCGACHSPRNALGAERGGARLAGGEAGGWTAPALTDASRAPIPWSEADFFAYLRTGRSRFHGVAAGPMAPVVRALADVPDADLRAMAVYLASFNPPPGEAGAREAAAVRLEQAAAARLGPAGGVGARIFAGACAVCHGPGGSGGPLALNSSVFAASPDNLIRVVLEGMADPPPGGVAVMPGFGGVLDDGQVAALVGYIREVFAPGERKWADLAGRVAQVRPSR
jgi:nicotinate dehydrogenase subunit B